MSNGLIVTAHGKLASGVESTIKLIVGSMDNLRVVDFIEGDTYDDIDAKLKEAYEDLSESKNIIFLTDLKGGTPFNRSVINFGSEENVRVLSGLNFASAYTALTSTEENPDNLASEVLQAGHEALDLFEAPKTSNEENDEDGI